MAPARWLPGHLLALAAGIIAAGVGLLFARYLPQHPSVWMGLALIPLWLLLEGLLEALVQVCSLRQRPGRLAVAAVVLAGFWGGALAYPLLAL